MPDDGFYKPSDADLLRMENELLALHVRFLKAQLNAMSEEPEGPGPDRLADLEEAEHEFIYLMRRLSRPPFGWILRLRRGFRVLQDRYL